MQRLEQQGAIVDAKWYCPRDSSCQGNTDDAKGFAEFQLISKVPHNPEEIVEVCGLDTDIWELKKGGVTFWGNEHYPCWRTKVGFIRRISEGGEKFLTSLKEEMKNYAPKYPEIDYNVPSSSESFLLEPSIYDAHFGSMSSVLQSGELYNPTIAQSRFYAAVVKSLLWYKNVNIDRILFPVGNDLMNADTILGQTTKLTPQDEHWDWQSTYTVAFQTVVGAIDLLQTIAPVYVPIVLSNHDQARIFYLGHALEAWYHNCPNVTIANTGSPYHFFAYGKNLIGLTHGKDLKKKNLPLLMATEARDLWGKATYSEWHIGHEHHSCIHDFVAESEQNGVRVRMIPSLCGRDFWHTYKGYGAIKEAVSLLWSKTDGNIADYKFHV